MLKSASRLTNAQELVPVQMGLYLVFGARNGF